MRCEKVFRRIDSFTGEMVSALIELCRIPAIGSLSGGDGEQRKAEFLSELLQGLEFDEILHYDAPDNRVTSKSRPNIVAKLRGQSQSGKMWIVSHMDTVPPGDLSEWHTDPFSPVEKEGRVYGLGVEDNGQGIIGSIYAVKAFLEEGKVPDMDICLAFVSDEEEGSAKGVRYLLERGLVSDSDLVLVPDWGTKDGSAIDVVEKGRLVVRITTDGVQCHPSRPHKGLNALVVSSHILEEIYDTLHKQFDRQDELFDPPWSTFEPTGRESSVININTVPGRDSWYLDCRIIPEYSPDDVREVIHKIAVKTQECFSKSIEGVSVRPQIRVQDIRHEFPAPKAPSNSRVVRLLTRAVKLSLGVEPKLVGAGSGTCASFFRMAGIPAVAWTIYEETAHQPNEYIRVENLILSCKAMASAIMGCRSE